MTLRILQWPSEIRLLVKHIDSMYENFVLSSGNFLKLPDLDCFSFLHFVVSMPVAVLAKIHALKKCVAQHFFAV